MDLYLVAKPSQETTTTGIVERADATVFGVYTTETRANHIAEKHDARVIKFVADQEVHKIVARWLNPGYIQSS